MSSGGKLLSDEHENHVNLRDVALETFIELNSTMSDLP
jgi:hypothetical protein